MERTPENGNERPKLNLSSDPRAVVEAMAQIEGPGWMALQLEVQEGRANPAEYQNSVQQALERIAQNERTVIYGIYGMNRWYVEEDGSVSFSRSHAASEDALKKAEALGFEIAP